MRNKHRLQLPDIETASFTLRAKNFVRHSAIYQQSGTVRLDYVGIALRRARYRDYPNGDYLSNARLAISRRQNLP